MQAQVCNTAAAAVLTQCTVLRLVYSSLLVVVRSVGTLRASPALHAHARCLCV